MLRFIRLLIVGCFITCYVYRHVCLCSCTHAGVRVARAATGQELIVKCDGCYHGHADHLLVAAGSGCATFNQPDSAGVPAAFAAHSVHGWRAWVLRYGAGTATLAATVEAIWTASSSILFTCWSAWNPAASAGSWWRAKMFMVDTS